MKITDLKCAVIGDHPIVRIVTDDGISGYGEVEHFKPTWAPIVLMTSINWRVPRSAGPNIRATMGPVTRLSIWRMRLVWTIVEICVLSSIRAR